MAEKIKQQWFLAGIILVFSLVIFEQTGTVARLGITLKDNNGASLMIFLIFLLSGMIIEVDQIRAGIRDIKATAAALAVIVGVSPVAGAAFSLIPMETGMALGLFLVAVMPTTLSSGVVMTGKAGGNMAHALFVTIAANCIAIVSIPMVLPWLLTRLSLETDLYIDQQAIFFKLLALVLLPLVIGLFLKKAVFTISADSKKRFSIINQCIVIGIVFMSLSSAREVLIAKAATFFLILPLVTGFHLVLLGAAVIFARILNIGSGRKEAVIFMGAQKTLPLSVMLQITCFPAYGTALLVCVTHHILHLMIDSFLTEKLKKPVRPPG